LYVREFLGPLAQGLFPIPSLPDVFVREPGRVVGQAGGLSHGFLGGIDVFLAVPEPLVGPVNKRAEIAALKKTPRNSSLTPSSEDPHASPTPDKPAVAPGASIFRARDLQLKCGVATMMAMPFH
jgi:hypothetical protein